MRDFSVWKFRDDHAAWLAERGFYPATVQILMRTCEVRNRATSARQILNRLGVN